MDEDTSGALVTADRRTHTTSASHVHLYVATDVMKSSSLIKIIEQSILLWWGVFSYSYSPTVVGRVQLQSDISGLPAALIGTVGTVLSSAR